MARVLSGSTAGRKPRDWDEVRRPLALEAWMLRAEEEARGAVRLRGTGIGLHAGPLRKDRNAEPRPRTGRCRGSVQDLGILFSKEEPRQPMTGGFGTGKESERRRDGESGAQMRVL